MIISLGDKMNDADPSNQEFLQSNKRKTMEGGVIV